MQLTSEKQSPSSHILVHGNIRIKWDVSVEKGFSKECDRVSGHGHQEAGVGEHHSTGSSSCYRNSVTCNTPQPCMLSLNRIV